MSKTFIPDSPFTYTESKNEKGDPKMKTGNSANILKTPQRGRDNLGSEGMILSKIVSLTSHLFPTVANEFEKQAKQIKQTPAEMESNMTNKDSQSMDISKQFFDQHTEGIVTPLAQVGQVRFDYDEESCSRVPTSAARSSTSPPGDFHSRKTTDWGYSPISPMAPQSQTSPKLNENELNGSDMLSPQTVSSHLSSIDNVGFDLEDKLLQKEADELLASIKKSRTPSTSYRRKRKTSINRMSSGLSQNTDYHSDSDDEYNDDDDLDMELSRLNDVAASLRTEMEELRFESIPMLACNEQLESRRSQSTWRFSTPSLKLPFELFSRSVSSGEEAALRMKTFQTYFGSSFSDQMVRNQGDEEYLADRSIQALYWALAFVWAVVILLAGHFELKGMNSWEDILDWWFQFGM